MKNSSVISGVALSISLLGCAVVTDEDSQSGHDSVEQWSYIGDSGPHRWHELDTSFELCEEGDAQSPIDLPEGAEPMDLPDVAIAYGQSSVHLEDNGHTVQYLYDDNHHVMVDGREYELLQFHFHALSEHALGGVHYPMEVHLVHREVGNDEHLLVLGVLIAKGEPHPLLDDARWAEISNAEGSSIIDESATFNVAELIPGGPTYRYHGSLTTPPCSEPVNWIVYQTPITFSAEQIATFSQLYPHNRRPLAELGSREIVFGE